MKLIVNRILWLALLSIKDLDLLILKKLLLLLLLLLLLCEKCIVLSLTIVTSSNLVSLRNQQNPV